jgi:hypothetical protein
MLAVICTRKTYMGQVMLSSLPHVKQEFPFRYKFDHWNKVLNAAVPSPPLPPSPTPIPPTKTSPNSPIQTPPKNNDR